MSSLSTSEIQKLLQALPSGVEELGRVLREGFSSPGKAVARKLTACIGAVNEHDLYVHRENQYVNCDPVPFIWVTGEDGAGKKDLIQRIKAECLSREYLLEFHCESVAPDQIEAELFGHRKHDVGNRKGDGSGKLSKAEAGLLCIYEPQTLPPAVQKRLLEWQGPGSLRRLGRNLPEPDPDPLVIFVARERPEALVQKETVLRGLLTNAMEGIQISPLREHPEDVVLLMQHFLRAKGAEFHRREFSLKRNLEPEVLWLLVNLHWPENVRALREVLTRLISHYLSSDYDHVITLREVVETLKTQYGPEILSKLTPSLRQGPLPRGQRRSGKKSIPAGEVNVFRRLIDDMVCRRDHLRHLLGLSPSQMSRMLNPPGLPCLRRDRPTKILPTVRSRSK